MNKKFLFPLLYPLSTKMGKKVILLFLLTSLILFSSLYAQRGFKVVVKTSEGSLELYNQYRALVIGVGDYLDWPKLPNAVKDAREVASVLKERGFITKILENPNYNGMKSALNSLINLESGPDDGVLIYYAGHGMTTRLADGNELGYIVPKDCPLFTKDPIGFYDKAISMEDMQTYSMQLPSKHLIVLFDSCFSGSIFTLGRAAPADISFKTARPVRQYITAGSADEIVPDKSIFKDCFLDALKGEADLNNDGYVTGSELGMYLESNVVNYSRNAQHPQYGKIRNPKLDKGDFVFILDTIEMSEAEGAQLSSQYGFLEITLYPFAEVIIDGKSIGEVPPIRRIKLLEGEHHIKLRKSEKEIFEETIHIEANKIKIFHHVFKK